MLYPLSFILVNKEGAGMDVSKHTLNLLAMACCTTRSVSSWLLLNTSGSLSGNLRLPPFRAISVESGLMYTKLTSLRSRALALVDLPAQTSRYVRYGQQHDSARGCRYRKPTMNPLPDPCGPAMMIARGFALDFLPEKLSRNTLRARCSNVLPVSDLAISILYTLDYFI